MRRAGIWFAITCVLAIVAAIAYTGTVDGTHSVPMSAVPAPVAPDGGALFAQAWTAAASSRSTARVEVDIHGTLHGANINGRVYRSQAAGDLLRVGWSSYDELHISEPQTAADAGMPAGHGDPTYICSGGDSGVHVSCDVYPVGLRK